MSKTRFFNFWNAQTYHFYQWVAEGGSVNAGDLVRKAMDGVESHEGYEIGMDVSTVARDVLAGLLRELLENTLADDDRGPGLHITSLDELPEIGAVGDSAFLLWGPILADALSGIVFEAVAQALLIREGKWVPDRNRPEVE
jgi:hypothetical protein